jgi:hypothetical protein
VSYRLLTPDEIIRLGHELEEYRRWEQVRDFVLTLYGPDAYQVEISVLPVYNDETYDEEANIIVTDQQGNQLTYDFSLPWWSSFEIAPEQREEFLKYDEGDVSSASMLGTDVSEALEAFCTEKLGIEFLEDVGGSLEPITSTYLIETPPAISHSNVYVEE